MNQKLRILLRAASALVVMASGMGSPIVLAAEKSKAQLIVHNTTDLSECNQILNSREVPLKAFIHMFSDYVPIVMSHNFPDDLATARFTKFSGRYGQLAFLTKNASGEYEVIIGHPEAKDQTGDHIWVKRQNGEEVKIALADTIAFTARDTRNRYAQFKREFAIAYKGQDRSWQKPEYIQALFNKVRTSQGYDIALQMEINRYHDWLEYLAKNNEQLALLVREPTTESDVILFGTVTPETYLVGYYNAIVCVDVKLSSGETVRIPIAFSPYTTGLLMMTNDGVAKLTSKGPAQLQRDYKFLHLNSAE